MAKKKLHTAEEQHAAMDKIGGFTYQFYCFLLHLLKMERGETVSFEKLDDAAIEKGNLITLYQSKHSVQVDANGETKALTNRSSDLWKAIDVSASFLLSRFELDTLFMTGFCAGFKSKKENFGDLFIADSEYDYGSGKLIKNDENEQEVMPEPKQMPCKYEVLSKMNDFITEDLIASKLYAEVKRRGLIVEDMGVPEIHVGPGACGSYVVGDKDFMDRLLSDDNRNLQGLDMEGYGLYLAGHMLNKNCVLVKGIADFGDRQKNDKYHKVCSYASAYFVAQYIRKRL